MSRFFNQNQQLQSHHEEKGPAPVGDIVEVLETIRESEDTQLSGIHGVVRNATVDNLLDIASQRDLSPDPQVKTEHLRRKVIATLACNRIRTSERNQDGSGIEAYRSLRTRLMRLQTTQDFRSMVVSSAVKGEGKTHTTMNLAACCAQLPNTRVLVIDADLRTGGMSRLLGHTEAQGLAEVLSGKAEYEQAIATTDIANLYVMGTGDLPLAPPELFASPNWRDLIRWANNSFQLVVVDSPPILPLSDFELIASGCERILLVVRAHQTEREVLEKAITRVEMKKLVGTVFNAALRVDNHDYRYGK